MERFEEKTLMTDCENNQQAYRWWELSSVAVLIMSKSSISAINLQKIPALNLVCLSPPLFSQPVCVLVIQSGGLIGSWSARLESKAKATVNTHRGNFGETSFVLCGTNFGLLTHFVTYSSSVEVVFLPEWVKQQIASFGGEKSPDYPSSCRLQWEYSSVLLFIVRIIPKKERPKRNLDK